MFSTLLTTKLFVPQAREAVKRPRLLDRLNEGLARKLTLLSAPAGFGKTTLLSEWIRQIELSVGWVSLDEGDNDSALFLAYLIAALQTIEPGIGKAVPAMLQSSQQAPEKPVLTALINEIAGIQKHFVLVLDDYHLIKADPIHNNLTFLLDHLPPQMHLVIATRADPPLPIARLRGRAQLIELRLADLRFTRAEVSEFFSRVMDLQLSADDIAALLSRTEGWIAGLQMAALSMRGRGDIPSYIQAFTGSNRYILDYLIEEVLQRQPDNSQTFLLQTSILDRLSGPLCNAVTGLGDGQMTLDRLERANLFTVPIDQERRGA